MSQSLDANFALLEPDVPSSSSSRPVVVLMGWVGAQRDGALLKYAELLTQQGYTTVRSVQPTVIAFSPLAGGRLRWALALLQFLEQQSLWPQRRLVLYAFSNGGAFVVEQLLLIAETPGTRYAQLPDTVAGVVFDSAPAFMHPGGMQRVLETSEPPGLSRWLRSRAYSLGHRLRALAGADWGPAFWSNMQRLHWDCPMLFLYSADDVLCDGAKVSELVAEKRRRGHDVRARCWQNSEHVAHMRHHRREYSDLLLGFLAELQLTGEGAAEGGAPGGGSVGLPVPRARL